MCVPVDDSAISQKRTAWVSCSCWRHRKQLTLAKTEDSHNGRCLINITQPFYDSWVWHVYQFAVNMSLSFHHHFSLLAVLDYIPCLSDLKNLETSRIFHQTLWVIFPRVCEYWIVTSIVKFSAVLNKIGGNRQSLKGKNASSTFENYISRYWYIIIWWL